MCGRFTQTANIEAVAERFGNARVPDEWASCLPRSMSRTPVRDTRSGADTTRPHLGATLAPRFNIAPTQSVIVVNDDGQRQLVAMRWGLIPSWAKDPAIGNRMINARAETIAEKPAFRAALRKRRCVIPADGFYEWQKKGNVKQPVRIVLKSRQSFGFAGLWEHWKPAEGEEVLSCTIITTEANELLKPVHERMPVILAPEAEAVWLDPKIQDPEKLLPLLKPYPSELMEFYAVSRIVNSPQNDTPECVVPL